MGRRAGAGERAKGGCECEMGCDATRCTSRDDGTRPERRLAEITRSAGYSPRQLLTVDTRDSTDCQASVRPTVFPSAGRRTRGCAFSAIAIRDRVRANPPQKSLAPPPSFPCVFVAREPRLLARCVRVRDDSSSTARSESSRSDRDHSGRRAAADRFAAPVPSTTARTRVATRGKLSILPTAAPSVVRLSHPTAQLSGTSTSSSSSSDQNGRRKNNFENTIQA